MSVAYLTMRETATRRATHRFFEMTRASAIDAETECEAVVNIQRLWRGYNARKYIQLLHFNATEIIRTWHGYKGREYVHWVRHQRLTDAERAYYDQMATQIQKVWRGTLSRQNKQDYYQRKKYIERVTVQSQKLLATNEVNQAKLDQYLQEQAEEQKGKEFVGITEDLHHLVGTKQIPSVFNSSYGEEFSTTAYGIPLESHIRENASNKIHASNQLRATKPPRRKNKTAVTKEEAPTKRISRKKKNSKKKRKERAAAKAAKAEGLGKVGTATLAATIAQPRACTSASVIVEDTQAKISAQAQA